MDLVLIFWGSFVLALSGALMPGPMLTATVSEAAKRGFRAGPLVVLGHGLLEILLLAFLVAGLGAWLTQDRFLGWLSLAGGLMLILMGGHMAATARRAVNAALNTPAEGATAMRGPILAGVLTSLSNPYWTIWWATIGLSYAAVSLKRGYAGLGLFFLGHILADFGWYSVVAAAVARSRAVCPPVVLRGMVTVCGLVLVGLGSWFIAAGWRRIA